MKSFRDEAVRIVDQRHGYTYEFAPDIDRHLLEYDAEEQRLIDDDMQNVVVRGFGYDVRHVARVPTGAIERMNWLSDFLGIRTPLIARCGKRIRSVQDAVVVMQPIKPTCELCKYITKDEEFDNTKLMGPAR